MLYIFWHWFMDTAGCTYGLYNTPSTSRGHLHMCWFLYTLVARIQGVMSRMGMGYDLLSINFALM